MAHCTDVAEDWPWTRQSLGRPVSARPQGPESKEEPADRYRWHIEAHRPQPFSTSGRVEQQGSLWRMRR